MKISKVYDRKQIVGMAKVSKEELLRYDSNNEIAISKHDRRHLEEFQDSDIVGYIAGDMEALLGISDYIKDPDYRFIDMKYFQENYFELNNAGLFGFEIALGLAKHKVSCRRENTSKEVNLLELDKLSAEDILADDWEIVK